MKLRALIFAVALPAVSFAQPNLQPSAPVVSAPVLKARKATVLTSKGMIGAIGDTVPLKGTLKSKAEGKPISGKTLSFKVAGKDVGTATTDAQGEARLDYKVPNDPPPGATPMQVRFPGDEEWGPSHVDANFGVFKASTKLTFGTPPSHINEGETAQLSGKLVRITDQAGIHGRELSITVNGKSAGKVATTNGSFNFSYPVPKPFPSKAKVHAQFEGDVLYAATAGQTEFAVMDPTKKAYLVWFPAKGKVGERVPLSATLSTNVLPGVGGISGQKVRFWMDRGPRWGLPHFENIPLCAGTTNQMGIATCSAKLEAAAYPFTLNAHADVNTDQWNVEKKSDPILDVNESPVHLALSGPASAHIGSTMSVKLKLTRTTDNAPIANASVFMGSSQKTNASGEATFSFAVPSGNTGARQFKATFPGVEKKYLNGEGSITVNVLPSVN